MPTFLRWLLIDLIVVRILRHRRVRPYVDRAFSTRPNLPGPYRYVRRRPRLACLSGCLALVAATALGLVLLVAVLHWAWSAL
ncbi:MAG TPA: hypothetical protein VIG86_03300 [Candidatus Dormibacteraeota bacterium]